MEQLFRNYILWELIKRIVTLSDVEVSFRYIEGRYSLSFGDYAINFGDDVTDEVIDLLKKFYLELEVGE